MWIPFLSIPASPLMAKGGPLFSLARRACSLSPFPSRSIPTQAYVHYKTRSRSRPPLFALGGQCYSTLVSCRPCLARFDEIQPDNDVLLTQCRMRPNHDKTTERSRRATEAVAVVNVVSTSMDSPATPPSSLLRGHFIVVICRRLIKQ